jgi:hypothetical protein
MHDEVFFPLQGHFWAQTFPQGQKASGTLKPGEQQHFNWHQLYSTVT